MKLKSRVNKSSPTVVAGVFFLVLFGMASFTRAATFTVNSTTDAATRSPATASAQREVKRN